MGYGDELMASALARGARARGRRVAFGDGTEIRWHANAHEIFLDNPNVAPPGSERDADLEWVAHYVGERPYNRISDDKKHWIWIPGKVREPGEVYLRESERAHARRHVGGRRFVLIEPNVPTFKGAMAQNKSWSVNKYQTLAARLRADGCEVVQLQYAPPYGPGRRLEGVRLVPSPSFRCALAVLERATLFVGGEGGMHHGAAAVDTPAVVIFGGFVSPEITGYSWHSNHYVGGEPCGSRLPCDHCRLAMSRISVSSVYDSCLEQLRKSANG